MIPTFQHDRVVLLHGDSRELILPDNSVDAVVCDPPYGLSKEPDMREVITHWLAGDDFAATGGGFMGKTWDSFVPGPAAWASVLRVLKPGGHLLAFFGSRTYDLGVLALRLAGFQIRDSLQWIYGSGFPKSLDVSKAIDNAAGAEQWEGWGTALKPAYEPIVLARKPLAGTVAANVLGFGTGALNVDGCRIGTSGGGTHCSNRDADGKCLGHTTGARSTSGETFHAQTDESIDKGRWPANVILDDAAGALLDAQAGHSVSRKSNAPRGKRPGGFGNVGADKGSGGSNGPTYDDAGGPSRFFYCPKAARAERDAGLEDFEPATGGEATDRKDGSAGLDNPRAGAGRRGGSRNIHPTVKPIELMKWLCRLITPPSGVILDPFVGSGSTGVAAIAEGFSFVGVDTSDEYLKIAEAHIKHALGES